ncbi:MAG UNVERIFIED_CONTAM: hypothetical protein LVR18_19360 [Planctomycetaceae bacterium]
MDSSDAYGSSTTILCGILPRLNSGIGRIDRLGSLTNRLRANDSTVTLDVLYPVIRGTGNSSGAETDNGPAGVSGAH